MGWGEQWPARKFGPARSPVRLAALCGASTGGTPVRRDQAARTGVVSAAGSDLYSRGSVSVSNGLDVTAGREPMASRTAIAPASLASPRCPRPRQTIVAPRLSVVIVNYRHWNDTARLVRRLWAAPSMRSGLVEVVVVDNHSPPSPLMGVLRRWPGVSLRRWGRNRGFACAVNEGCRLSRGEWFLLLNPDVTVPRGFLDEALARAERLAAQDP